MSKIIRIANRFKNIIKRAQEYFWIDWYNKAGSNQVKFDKIAKLIDNSANGFIGNEPITNYLANLKGDPIYEAIMDYYNSGGRRALKA
jgi:hypothetical protein